MDREKPHQADICFRTRTELHIFQHQQPAPVCQRDDARRQADTGTKRGAEIVQLYVKDVEASVDRPVKELKGFKKVWLNPSEQQDVDITIDNTALAFYDETSSSWKSENGVFEVLIGNASDHITQKARFTLK